MALVTEEFWAQGDFVARSVGMPDIPRIRLPHPVAGTGGAHMAEVAGDITPHIVASWQGS